MKLQHDMCTKSMPDCKKNIEKVADRRGNIFVLLLSPINGEGNKNCEPIIPITYRMRRFEWEYLTQFLYKDLYF